ncbi:unnamed protein product [Eruca vesicaria subsp. sativa]|uniref:Uncharacterized protein n=1 Tax=Eruca vesicaria subsp. sativa TaxID=29727 RepID=A0ABC8K2I8_ERUVS|nr:unnamed protein product [Eruca vesicaria subsp. sativa]
MSPRLVLLHQERRYILFGDGFLVSWVKLSYDLDSSVLKALEEEPKKERATDVKNLPAPTVRKDVLEPLPDESGPHNRMEVSKDGGREDEKLLTEFARRTLEVFIVYHILCTKKKKKEVEGAYKEAIALKMQEELIREEENLNKRRVKSTKFVKK